MRWGVGARPRGVGGELGAVRLGGVRALNTCEWEVGARGHSSAGQTSSSPRARKSPPWTRLRKGLRGADEEGGSPCWVGEGSLMEGRGPFLASCPHRGLPLASPFCLCGP